MAAVENQEQWKCHSYVEAFDTRGKGDAHHRKVHQKSTVEKSGSTQVQHSVAGKFICEYGNSYDRAQSLKWHRPGYYATIGIIEGGKNSSKDEGTFSYSEGLYVCNLIFSVLQCLILHCLFHYEFANIRTQQYRNG